MCRKAKLTSTARFNQHYGNHVEIHSANGTPGRYIATPANRDQIKVRWYPHQGRETVLGLVPSAPRAAGLILDHQEGLLL